MVIHYFLQNKMGNITKCFQTWRKLLNKNHGIKYFCRISGNKWTSWTTFSNIFIKALFGFSFSIRLCYCPEKWTEIFCFQLVVTMSILTGVVLDKLFNESFFWMDFPKYLSAHKTSYQVSYLDRYLRDKDLWDNHVSLLFP